MSIINRKRNRHSKSAGRSADRSATSIEYGKLEPRLALTTFVINSVADDVGGTLIGISLREAIIAANTNAAFGNAPAGTSGDRIRFDPSIAGRTLLLTGGEMQITDDLLIQGAGSNITIDGNGNGIFRITTNEQVSFGGLTFIRGSAAVGGAIASVGGGTVVVTGSTFRANAATGLGGGAIYHEVGNLYVTDSTFQNNQATGGAGSGGAILSASGLTSVRGGSMTVNIANRAGGAIEVIDGTFYAFDVIVGGDAGRGNSAGPVGSANPGNGGGLHVSGVATVGITGGRFFGNFAAGEGGGLWNQAGSRMFIRSNALISNNVAGGSAADDGGGGVFNNGGSVYISTSSIVNNRANGANGSGGGIFSTAGTVLVSASTLSGNVAARAGGGVEIIDGNLRFVGSTVSNNDAGITLTAAPGIGGGLHVTGSLAFVVVSGGQFSNNRAFSEGGGLWNQNGSALFIRDGAVITNNSTTGSISTGGGVHNLGYLSALDAVFSMNSTAQIGGAIVNGATGQLSVENTSFIQNASGVRGGAIYNFKLSKILNSRFLSNLTSFSGGAWFTNPTAITIQSGNTFSGNAPNNFN